MSESKINDGGPAFPCINPKYDGNWNKEPVIEGMSVRMWLAGLAMQGMLSVPGMMRDGEPEGCAIRAFTFADAMLAESTKQEESK